LKTEDITYRDDALEMTGFAAYDDSTTAKRPGILVVHEAWGLGTHAMDRARRLAGLGYVALAADLYGDRKQATDIPSVMELIKDLRSDPAMLRKRAGSALAALAALPQVDTSKLAAIGFCFGGTTVLELARGGYDLKGVVSFHGALETGTPATQGAVKAKVLVCTGADDPMIPLPTVVAFEDEMRKAGADWQVITYGGTLHSFTNPSPVSNEGAAYNESADRRSWTAMRAFFDEIFA
jgi:dienelactone hydrolase